LAAELDHHLNTVRLDKRSEVRWRAAFLGAALAITVGLFFWSTRLGDGLKLLSYDLLVLFKAGASPTEAVIIYVDEKSCQELRQDAKNWDRALHARLLDHLKAEGARLVVFDVIFDKLRDPATDQELARAIKANGRVVLAAEWTLESRPEMAASSVTKPAEPFLQAAAGWGVAAVEHDAVIRRFVPVTMLGSNLAYTAATLAGGKPLNPLPILNEQRWLNYYGAQGTIRSVSYCEVTNQPAGFFRDRIVFVGGRPSTPHLFDQAEEFQTPLTRWGDAYSPGVEILTTAFLNLYRGESLVRASGSQELLLLLIWGLLVGAALSLCRPWYALGGAAVAALLAVTLGALAFSRQHAWFPWVLLAGVQVPCALGWSVLSHVARQRRRTLTAARARPSPIPGVSPSVAEIIQRMPREQAIAPPIPDHTLVRNVGSGAYGDVWLAQNAIGLYRAVKIIYRAAFETADPYEREFRGISKFMPISLTHPKLVHVLHVGRNDQEGYFYYIMEAADDEATGPTINPNTYSPRSLSKELSKRKRYPASEVIQLGLDLGAALQYLHQCQLIHRDIKPANIIYVSNVPKMADIGLVTDIQRKGAGTTYVGTEGYIPPEGPGSAAADVFSLGKVLYQAATGMSVDQFPLLPTSIVNNADDAAMRSLNEVIVKACEKQPAERYQTAAELITALESLRKQT
jgi:CHASE2 domain-containing sensor protein